MLYVFVHVCSIIKAALYRYCSVSVLLFLSFATQLSAQTSDDITAEFEEAKQQFLYREYNKAIEKLNMITPELCSRDYLLEKCVESKAIGVNIYRNLSEYDKAEIVFREGQDIIHEYLDENHPLGVRLYVEKFYLTFDNSTLNEAGIWAHKAAEITETVPLYGLPRAEAYRTLGFFNDGLGDYTTSIENYKEALSALEGKEITLEITNALTAIHNNIGVSYRRLGKIDSAMVHYQKTLSLVRKTFGSNHVQLAYAYNSIGTVYYTIGDFGTAGDYFLRSADIFQSNMGDDSPNRAAALNNAAASFTNLNDLDSALPILESAQQIKVRTLGKNHPETAVGYTNLGSIHARNNDFDTALQYHELSIELRKNIYGIDHPDLVSPYIHISDLFKKMGEYTKAREHLREALHIVQTRLGEYHPEVWSIKNRLAESYAKENNLIRSEEYYTDVMYMMIAESGMALTFEPDFSKLSHPVDFLNTIKGISNNYLEKYKSSEDVNSLREGLFYYKLAADLVDFIQTEFQSEASKLNLIDENYSIYTGAIEICYYLYQETSEKTWLDEILYLNELSRARIALELVQESEARNFAGVSDDILEQERELNFAITEFYRQLHLEQEKGFDADEAAIAEYRDSLFYAKEHLHQFTSRLENDYPEYFRLKYDRRLVDRIDVIGLLDTDETLVNYLFTENYLFALLISHDDISIHKLNSSDKIADSIEKLRKAVNSGNTNEFIEYSSVLFEVLIKPFDNQIRTNSVIIIPDQVLHYLPFEMLLTEKPDDLRYYQMPFLIKNKKITYAQSATLLNYMSDSRPSSPGNLFAMAPFNQNIAVSDDGTAVDRYLTGLTPLPLTRYETKKIAEIFNTRRTLIDYIFPEITDVYLDREATRSRFLSSPLEGYGFIHLATHAFVHETNPELSGIALWSDDGSDGIVRVGDIYNLRMNADLVVLGACETGLGRMYRGEGLIGFTRAFIYAGASNLVVSMWRVNDQPTAMLMINFYENIKNGYSYGEALQMAKLNLINHPEHSAPRNWAAFILQGR